MNDSLILEEIYLLSENKKELDFFIKFLERNPHIKLVIGSVNENIDLTNTIGNINLSIAREAFDYLIASGVNSSKLIFDQKVTLHRPIYKIIKAHQ